MEELRKEQAATKNNELEDKDEMSLQTLQNEIVDEDRGRAGITSDPLDMARMVLLLLAQEAFQSCLKVYMV